MPEKPRLVVVNTTPIIALALLGKLDLLRQLYGQVVTPSAVQAEVFAGGSTGVGRFELQDAAWLRVVSLQDPRRADLLADLDRGEAEVIALAQEIDAERLGLRLAGTLGVLLKAKQLGLVDAIAPLIEHLQLAGIRLSDAVVATVLKLADEK
jgi:hypothetical protein